MMPWMQHNDEKPVLTSAAAGTTIWQATRWECLELWCRPHASHARALANGHANDAWRHAANAGHGIWASHGLHASWLLATW